MAAPHAPLPPARRLSAVERREQLAFVAARQFHRFGYHGVSIKDVAAEAGVTAPAVYRHFENKQALLAAAVSSGLTLVERAVTSHQDGPLEELVASVAEVGLQRADMWVLLQREARFLTPELRRPVLEQFARVTDGFASSLMRARPDLPIEDAQFLITGATAVLSLPSITSTRLSADAYRRVLTTLALACLRTDLGAGPRCRATASAAAGRDTDQGRRAQVVNTAIDLFYRFGYGEVSLDDIGAGIGIAGPSILHHFPTKADILVEAFDRASGSLSGPQSARRRATQPPRLDEVVCSYIRLCLDNRSLLGVFVSEPLHLPAPALSRTVEVVSHEERDWTRALRSSLPGLDEPSARLRVRAAMAAINDLVRLGHFAQRREAASELSALARAVLHAEEPAWLVTPLGR